MNTRGEERNKNKKLGAKMERIKMLTRNIRTSYKLYLMRLMMLPILVVAMANKWIYNDRYIDHEMDVRVYETAREN